MSDCRNLACAQATLRRYPLTELYRPRVDQPDVVSSAHTLFPKCAVHDHRSLPQERGPPDVVESGAPRADAESFVSSALRSTRRAACRALRQRLIDHSREKARERGARAAGDLACDSPVRTLNRQLLLMIGVPSHTELKAKGRRAAARASWIEKNVGEAPNFAVCFLLSSWAEDALHASLLAEHAAHGDMLFVDAPETPMVLRGRTRYSNFTKLGRGMPTFKQCAAPLLQPRLSRITQRRSRGGSRPVQRPALEASAFVAATCPSPLFDSVARL